MIFEAVLGWLIYEDSHGFNLLHLLYMTHMATNISQSYFNCFNTLRQHIFP